MSVWRNTGWTQSRSARVIRPQVLRRQQKSLLLTPDVPQGPNASRPLTVDNGTGHFKIFILGIDGFHNVSEWTLS